MKNKSGIDLCVIGLGYVGLPTACVFANAGLKVLGVDTNVSLVDELKSYRTRLNEPDLNVFITAALRSGNLRIGTSVETARAYIIAVPTPLIDTDDYDSRKDASRLNAMDSTRRITNKCLEGLAMVLPSKTLQSLRTRIESALIEGADQDDDDKSRKNRFRRYSLRERRSDISYVESAAVSISRGIGRDGLVIVESTVPVGTTRRVREIMAAELKRSRGAVGVQVSKTIKYAHCPERVLPGSTLQEITQNDRVVGGVDSASTDAAKTLYSKICSGVLLETDDLTAEVVKLSENAYRDVNIAFANELANICDSIGVDVFDVIKLANRHPRVKILQPGPGVGGHCIAVDPWFLHEAAPEDSSLIPAARFVNDRRSIRIAKRVVALCGGKSTTTIACLGLAYKKDIEDVRSSPAMTIVRNIADANVGLVYVVDPFLRALPPALMNRNNVKLCDVAVALQKANVIVLLVDHTAFREIDTRLLMGKTVVDTRGFWRG